jgi:hypothetical protein
LFVPINMENIEVYENETYQKGDKTPETWSNIFHYFLINVILVVKITAIMISEPFIAIWYYFTKKSSGSKNIEGQVALITGF